MGKGGIIGGGGNQLTHQPAPSTRSRIVRKSQSVRRNTIGILLSRPKGVSREVKREV